MSIPFLPLSVDSELCWLWPGGLSGNGYAQVRVSGKLEYLHRVMYELAVEAIPAGLEVDHLCHNRSCINPSHLEAVTHAENMRRNRADTCPNGHDMTDPTNIRIGKRGRRTCRACLR